MENDPSLEFEFFLAEKLRMTVAELRQRMSNEEFMQWSVFLGRRAQREQIERAKARSR